MTDDFEILLHWGIVPQYRQSIAFRNSLLDAFLFLSLTQTFIVPLRPDHWEVLAGCGAVLAKKSPAFSFCEVR